MVRSLADRTFELWPVQLHAERAVAERREGDEVVPVAAEELEQAPRRGQRAEVRRERLPRLPAH